MAQQDSNWYRLDNVARIYPAASSLTATCVFRLSARMIEPVSEEILDKAVQRALSEVPAFQVRLRKGVFWYYFELNNGVPRVKEESNYPCRRIDRNTNNGFLFDVTYKGRYIHTEYFHALCDGTGALDFFRRVVTHYSMLAYPGAPRVTLKQGDSLPASQEDGSARIIEEGAAGKGEKLVKQRAYKPSSTLTQNGELKIIKGIMPTALLKEKSKAMGVTITALLCGVLAYSYWRENFRYEPVKRPITVCIPVNLRKFFPSSTLRNFFTSAVSQIHCFGKELTVEEAIRETAENLAKELNSETLYQRVLYPVKKQENLALRFVPLFIKNAVLKFLYNNGEQGYTVAFSNLGVITMPEGISQYVERVEFILSPTMVTRCKVGFCSLGDTSVVSFCSNSENTEVQRRFFLTLKELGIDAVLSK